MIAFRPRQLSGLGHFLRTPSLSRTIVGLLTVAITLLLAANIATFVMIGRSAEFNAHVDHTQQVRLRSRDVLNLLIDAESRQRGFILTDNEADLVAYREAVEELPHALDSLEALTRDTPDEAQRVADLRRLTEGRFQVIEHNLALVQAGRRSEAIARIRAGQGRVQMDAMRLQIAAIDAEEARNLAQRTEQSQSSLRSTVLMNAFAGLVILLLAGVSILLVRRHLEEIQTAREAISRLNEGLEDTVRARTADLIRANEEIQRFAYIVSHDLRAPLVNVMGYTAELEQAGQDFARQLTVLEARAPELLDPEAVRAIREDVPEAVGFIRTSTQKMDRLINAILRLSRDGRRNLSSAPVDMTFLVSQIADSVRHQTDSADARIEIGDLPTIESDRLALEQVFSNLIDNAVKYLDPARPGVVSISGEETPDGQVVYVVSDNGRGISDRDHERIFELFRRSGRQDTPGEGLGLAFVRNSVRRLGGSVAVESEFGKGSTFRLKFPKRLLLEAGEAA